MRWIVAMLLTACGGTSALGELCTGAETCPTDMECANATIRNVSSMCLLPRQNGEECPAGGAPVAWGETTCAPSGCTIMSAHFACARRCDSDDDCLSGTICQQPDRICFPP